MSLLSDEEIEKAFDDIPEDIYDGYKSIARAIEAAVMAKLKAQRENFDEKLPDFFISNLSMNTIKYNSAVHEKQYFSKNKYEDCVIPVYFHPIPADDVVRQRVAELEAELRSIISEKVIVESELAACREDAERYRHIRDDGHGVTLSVMVVSNEDDGPVECWIHGFPPDELNRAIDAARNNHATQET